MADYDRRQGGGYNRKRRYRDDDDNHYDRRNNHQRRRVESAPAPVRLRRQLVGIADSPLRRWAEEVQGVAKLMAENEDDSQLKETFINLVKQLLVEQPLKTPFVAAVVRTLNALKPEMTPGVLEAVAQSLEKSIADGEWRDAKLYLKFFACLQGMLDGEGLFPLLEELFLRAADLQTASSEDTIGTEIVKIILLTIPYVMTSAPEEHKANAADLLAKTDIIASEPHSLQALVEPFQAEEGDENFKASPSLCMLLQKQVQAEADDDWKLVFLPRPWDMGLEHVEMQDKITSAPKQALPEIKVPTNVVTGPRPLFPEVYFSVYADQEVDSVPGQSSLASSLIRDSITDTVNILNFNRNITARFLMDIDSYFADGTFVKRATPFDELKNMKAEGRSTWKPEDVAVDAVFSQLFQLPATDCKVVYYHSLLMEACKLAPAAIAPSLGRAIRFLYRNSPRMDIELSYRFVEWFAHHLSNFGFTWKWTEWSSDASLPDLHPSKWFIKGALDKEIRLSFAQRIQKTLPEEYQHLIGPEKEQDEPPFKYKNPDERFSAEGQELANMLRRKATDEDMQPVFDTIQTKAAEHGLDATAESMDVFVTAICWVGSKSLSHVLACIDRSTTRLLDASVASASARAQILSSVVAYWHAHPGIALSILEKLLNYSILTPLSVVDWAIGGETSPNGLEGGRALGEPHVLELVTRTAAKVKSRVRQVLNADPSGGEDEVAQMRELFAAISDALTQWSAGTKSQMALSDGDAALARRWGDRWQRLFKRQASIEEAFVAEARAKPAGDVAMESNGADL